MLTKLVVRRFKALEAVEIPLGQSVVLIGPNNSGKTTALQALLLWHTGMEEWIARRSGTSAADERTGVTINRRSLTHTPVADTRSFWQNLRVSSGGQKVYIEIFVEGDGAGGAWTSGFEFYHANSESIYCRPVRLDGDPPRLEVPQPARDVRIAMLPPMSGLVAEEPEVQPGRITVLLGEGQTAQVLRNLCLLVFQRHPDRWARIVVEIERLFGVRLGQPTRDPARGSVQLTYKQNKVELDLPSAGRGLQQTLLLLAHLHLNPSSVLLLDEPDAHLEILRQRQIYNLLTETAETTRSQVIAASHSEVILNEAADKHVVVAFVGKPHRIDDRGGGVLKSLKEIGFEHYYQAERKGFVLYVEGATDLAILRRLAQLLKHDAAQVLDDVFVHYVGNQPNTALHHYFGLREAKSDLTAVAIFDRLERGLPESFAIPCHVWKRREIENYFTTRATLVRYAKGVEPADLVDLAEVNTRQQAMEQAIDQIEGNLRGLEQDPWSTDFKVSDNFLPLIFKRYFERLSIDDRIAKSDFHVLVPFLQPNEIDAEIRSALDLIAAKAALARPRE